MAADVQITTKNLNTLSVFLDVYIKLHAALEMLIFIDTHNFLVLFYIEFVNFPRTPHLTIIRIISYIYY